MAHWTQLLMHLVLSGVLIIGAYQFYFWCQRNMIFAPRVLPSKWDDRIPFLPQWVWIYSLLYYPAILLVNFTLQTSGQFALVATSYLFLLGLQMVFFLLLPVETPPHWREVNRGHSLSERFLAFVQRFDAASNSFPSMHTSVAMLTALYLRPEWGELAFAFPVLIGLSCLFTKQHYMVDVPAGAALGAVPWMLFGKYAVVAIA
jgi:membrane-associated phospholipid phosphatase